MLRNRRAESRGAAAGLTLLEALVALTIFSVGIVGLASGLSMSRRAGSEAVLLDEAVLIAQRELAAATARRGQELGPLSGVAGRYRWEVNYVEKRQGLVVATVRVTWSMRGQIQHFALSQLFLPGSAGTDDESLAARGTTNAS